MNKPNTKPPSIYSSSRNASRDNSQIKNSLIMNNSSNYLDISNIDKNLSPKSNFNFSNKLVSQTNSSKKSKPPQSKNIRIINHDNEYINDSTMNYSGITSVDNYFQRRHLQTQEKLIKLKNEQIKKEKEHLRDRPRISENSRKIIDRITNNADVFERLTNKNQERKKLEEIQKIEEINNKNKEKPEINESSKNLQRTIDDLYYWKYNLEEKKTKELETINKVKIVFKYFSANKTNSSSFKKLRKYLERK